MIPQMIQIKGTYNNKFEMNKSSGGPGPVPSYPYPRHGIIEDKQNIIHSQSSANNIPKIYMNIDHKPKIFYFTQNHPT